MIHPYDTSINHENLVIQWIIISHHRIHPPIYHTLQIMTDQPAAMKSRGAAWIWDKSSKDESMAKWRLNSWVYHFRIMYHSIHIIYYIYIYIFLYTVIQYLEIYRERETGCFNLRYFRLSCSRISPLFSASLLRHQHPHLMAMWGTILGSIASAPGSPQEWWSYGSRV